MPRTPSKKVLTVIICAVALLTGCDTGDVPPTIPIHNATPTPETSETGAGATPTVTSGPAPAPTPAPWQGEMLNPGPTFDPPGQIFFQNGPDIWLLDSELRARQVTSDRRISQMASAPDGSRAALVARTELGSRAAEQLVLINPDGSASEPLYGPSVIAGPGANPAVESLVWSPDGAKLALVFADGSIKIITVGGEGVGEAVDISPIEDGQQIEQFVWAPDGTGGALLTRNADGVGQLSLIPADGSDQVTLEEGLSYGVISWLPGHGRLVAAEDRALPANPYSGSIFSIAPDGTGRELLVSAGRFAPVATVLEIATAPNGQWIAFGVYTPDLEGDPEFQSLWIRIMDSGELVQVPVQNNLRVTDLWWTAQGLVWRGVDEQVPRAGGITEYTGSEPFVLSVYNPAEQISRVVFQGGAQQ